MPRQDIACLILAYKRPESTSSLIKQCVEQGVSRIYIAVDGPKSREDEAIQVLLVNEITQKAIDIPVTIWHRQENAGLAASVITAIDWFFLQESRGVILEDDLVLASGAMEYFDAALAYYKNERRVWLISGSSPFAELGYNSKARYPMIWGWATWADRWTEMRWELVHGKYSSPSKWKVATDSYWKACLFKGRSGLSNSWAAPLAAMQYSVGRWTVLPEYNLVQNNGVDAAATHTLKASEFINKGLSQNSIEIFHKLDELIDVSGKFESDMYKISPKNIFSNLKAKLHYRALKMKGSRITPLQLKIVRFAHDQK